MAYEHKDMTASVFKNTRKRDEKDANLTGSGKIFGKDVWANVYVKKDKNGDTMLYLTFREKQSRPQNDDAPTKTQSKHDIEIDDNIPF